MRTELNRASHWQHDRATGMNDNNDQSPPSTADGFNAWAEGMQWGEEVNVDTCPANTQSHKTEQQLDLFGGNAGE